MTSISRANVIMIFVLSIFVNVNCIPVTRNIGTRHGGITQEIYAGNVTQRGSNDSLILAEALSLPVEESSTEVRETHHTTCQVTSEELVATAKATVTRVLKGLCNSREMEERFLNLEYRLTEQLNLIKSLLLKMEEKEEAHNENMKKGQRKVLSTLMMKACPLAETISTHAKESEQPTIANISEAARSITDLSSDETDQAVHDSVTGPRDAEITVYNSTIHTEPSALTPGQLHTAFTYYWRISRMAYKLQHWSHRRSSRSSSFYISPKGYRMYLRIYPRQSGENVFVHVGLTRGSFDSTLSWPFKLKHRIHIMDQVSAVPEDIVSRIWDPAVLCSGFNWQRPMSGDNYECVGLGFPHAVVRSRNYIKDDNLIIKLIVYMD